MAVPRVPRADASWFQPIKAQNKKLTVPAFKKAGVPTNAAISPQDNHGYWLRYNRNKPGGGSLPAAFSFYYTGTGPYATLKFGDTTSDRVTWVKGPNAVTTNKPKVAKRDPDKHPLMPLTFPAGDGPTSGFRIDPFNQARGRQMQRGNNPRSSSMPVDTNNRQQRARSKSAPGRTTPKQHNIPKRTLTKGKTISQVFGKRSLDGANVGSADTERAGFTDPRLMCLMRHTPGTQELLLAGHITHNIQPEGVYLTFTYTTQVKRESGEYDRVVEALNTVVNQKYDSDNLPASSKKEKDRTPKTQKLQQKNEKKEGKKQKAKEQQETPKVESAETEVKKIQWADDSEEYTTSFS